MARSLEGTPSGRQIVPISWGVDSPEGSRTGGDGLVFGRLASLVLVRTDVGFPGLASEQGLGGGLPAAVRDHIPQTLCIHNPININMPA